MPSRKSPPAQPVISPAAARDAKRLAGLAKPAAKAAPKKGR